MAVVPRQRPAFAFSVAAAVALNGLAIGVFGAAVERWHVPSGSPGQTSWITAVTVARPTPVPVVVATPAPVPAATEPPPRTAGAAPKSPPASAEAGEPVRFYRSSEVDRPAEPDSDWNLDTAVLDAAGIETLVFDIFIGRSGEVVGFTILEPATLRAEARHTIEQRLLQTTLQPAVRGGAAVASVRRIEVSTLAPTQ